MEKMQAKDFTDADLIAWGLSDLYDHLTHSSSASREHFGSKMAAELAVRCKALALVDHDTFRRALAELRDFELQQTRYMDSETRRDGPQPPNGDDWNDLSAAVRLACEALPPKRYCVDGSTTIDPAGSVFTGDGKFPPFVIFDIDAGETVETDKRFVYFLTRETAERAMAELMEGTPADELFVDALHEFPAGYRPLGAHERVAPGVLAIAQADEPDTDNEGEDRITPTGAVWIVTGFPGDDAISIVCYRTGAAINPCEMELRDPTQFHLYVRA